MSRPAATANAPAKRGRPAKVVKAPAKPATKSAITKRKTSQDPDMVPHKAPEDAASKPSKNSTFKARVFHSNLTQL